MPSFDDFIPGKDLKVILKGEPATRKTSAAASFPGTTKWWDADHKIGSLWTPKQKGLVAAEIDYEEINTYIDLKPKLIQQTKYNPYDNTVIDSLSNLIDRQLYAWSKDGKKITRGIKVNEIEDWLAESTMITELMEIIEEISGNVFLICHVWKSEQEILGSPVRILRQIVTGGKKAAAKLPSKFNEVWHFQSEAGIETETTEYKCLFENSEIDFARTALGIPRKIDWTDKSFYECIAPYLNGEEGTLEKMRREQKEEEKAKLSNF